MNVYQSHATTKSSNNTDMQVMMWTWIKGMLTPSLQSFFLQGIIHNNIFNA